MNENYNPIWIGSAIIACQIIFWAFVLTNQKIRFAEKTIAELEKKCWDLQKQIYRIK